MTTSSAIPRAHPNATAQGSSKLLDGWIFLTLLMPIYGTCFPPQTYFYSGNIHEQTFEAGWQMPAILLTLAVSVVLMAIHHIKQGRRIGHDPVIYLFILAAFASIPMADQFGYSFNRALRLLPLVGFGVLYAQIIPWRRMLSLMTAAFLVSACISIFISLALPQYGMSHYEGVYESAWRGATGHKNAAGALYAIGVIVGVHTLLTPGGNRKIAIAAIATSFLVLVKSQSATGLSTTLMVLPIYGALRLLQRAQPRIRLLAILFAVLAAAAVLMTLSAFPLIGTSLLGRDSTLTGRTEIWQAVWWAIQEAPIRGHGYGFWGTDSKTLAEINTLVGFAPGHSHEDWLDIWLQIGIFGVIAIAADILYVLFGSLKLLLTTDSPEPALLIALMLFCVIRSFVEVQFTDPGPSSLFWLVWCSAAVTVMSKAHRRSGQFASEPSFQARAAVAA